MIQDEYLSDLLGIAGPRSDSAENAPVIEPTEQDLLGNIAIVDSTPSRSAFFPTELPEPEVPRDFGSKLRYIADDVYEGFKAAPGRVVGAMEGATEILTDLIAFVPAIATTVGASVLGHEGGREAGGKVGEFLGGLYEPTTEYGRQAVAPYKKGLEYAGEAMQWGAEQMAPGSPEDQAMLMTVGEVGLLAAGAKVKGGVKTIKNKLRSKYNTIPERPVSKSVMEKYYNERLRKREKLLTAEEMESVVDRGEAVKAARANPSRLQQDAMARKVPGAEDGIFKTKENGTMRVTVDETVQLIDPAIPDLPMNRLERLSTNMVHTVKSHPLFKALYDGYQYVDRAHLQEFAGIKKNVVGGWKRRLGEAGLKWRVSNERIANHLTGLQEGGPAVLKSMGKRLIKEADLKPMELQIIKEIRTTYDSFFRRINQARELAGKDPIKYVDNYYSWMRNLDSMREMGFSFIESTAAEINSALSATPLRFAKTRKGIFPSPVSLDFFNVFELYAKDSLKHIHYSPVIAKGRALLENFDLPGIKSGAKGQALRIGYKMKHDRPVMAQAMEQWINQIAGKGDLSNIPDHAWIQKKLATVNRNIAVSTLGLNARSAFIQWTALRGALTEAGLTHTAKGLMQNMRSPAKRDFAMRESQHLFGRNMDIHVSDTINRATKGKIKNINKALQDGSLSILQIVDMETARSSWLAHYDFYTKRLRKSQRLSHVEAVKAADEAIIRHQASGKIGDVAPMQRGIAGRLATIFQTFTIAEWNWMMRDVLGIKNPEVNLGQAMVRTTRFLMTTATVNAIFEDLLGVPSPFPAPERAIREGIKEGKPALKVAGDVGLEMLEAVPVIGAPIKFSQKWRSSSPAASVQLATDLYKVANKMIAQNWEDITIYDLEAFAKLAGLPGAAQARKTVSRLKKGEPVWSAIMGGTGNKPSGGFGLMR